MGGCSYRRTTHLAGVASPFILRVIRGLSYCTWGEWRPHLDSPPHRGRAVFGSRRRRGPSRPPGTRRRRRRSGRASCSRRKRAFCRTCIDRKRASDSNEYSSEWSCQLHSSKKSIRSHLRKTWPWRKQCLALVSPLAWEVGGEVCCDLIDSSVCFHPSACTSMRSAAPPARGGVSPPPPR